MNSEGKRDEGEDYALNAWTVVHFLEVPGDVSGETSRTSSAGIVYAGVNAHGCGDELSSFVDVCTMLCRLDTGSKDHPNDWDLQKLIYGRAGCSLVLLVRGG
ncbi:hypothetical protein WH47_05342 [Habropoda laboriosa]|uniref:Uncharacterized protein n=1 Tax=Habropoda laboriosa TaxID=597456 RepID=A0A0L7QTY2_9HYME|nr:hypothetical protein WH47_05342 [Habropoda laboriosa]